MNRVRPRFTKRRSRLPLVVLTGVTTALILALGAGPSSATVRLDDNGAASVGRVLTASVSPIFVADNPSRTDLIPGSLEYKREPVSGGSNLGPIGVDITLVNTADGPTFNFSGVDPAFTVLGVIVKGGDNANF